MQNYYDMITELRIIRGKSQKEIADILNTSQQYYGQYELGKRKLPFEHAIKLAIYYNITLDYIAGLTPIERPLFNVNEK